jgi:hypothetical protein
MPILAAAAGVTLAAFGAGWSAGAAGTGAPRSLGPPPGASAPATQPAEGGRFYGVAATSSGNAWAVGLQGSESLIMRWSASPSGVYRWRVSFTKPVGYFIGVAATSASNAWAVGGTNWFSPSQTLAEQWNGKTWTRMPTPTPGGTGYFEGVAATSPSNAWAVGLIGPGPGIPSATTPLIEHWNGKVWTQARIAEPADGGQFGAVTAISASNVWAVGQTGESSEGSGQTTLIEHWNGRAWTRVPSPNRPGNFSELTGVAATGPDDAWAVGTSGSGPGGSYQSLMLHWNGHKWALVASPNPTGQTDLIRVAAASPDDAWAVGYTNPNVCGNGGPQCGTAAFHWNGSRWAAVPSANPPAGYLNAFEGVVIVSADNAWAVGTTDWASTLIEHWNGRAWIWHLPS